MDRILHEATINQDIYKERVNRTEAFLGRTPEEQKKSQEILSESTIGIAGTGGIGGAMALRLARFGVKHIKIADPEYFDWTNVNPKSKNRTNNNPKPHQTSKKITTTLKLCNS